MKRVWIFICVAILIYPGKAWSGVTTIQAMTFGKWIVTDNSVDQSVTINTDGSYNASAGLIEINQPHEGVYQIDGLTPDATINDVTITMTQPLELAGAQSFTIDDFNVDFPSTVDSSGKATITIGATASRTGGGLYANGTHIGELEISFDLAP